MQKYPWFSNTQICGAFINWTEKIQKSVLAKFWGLGFCDEDLLISSDRPVFVSSKLKTPEDIDGLVNSSIYFPLSPNLILIGTPNNKRHCLIMKAKRLAEIQVNTFNTITFINARSVVIANNESLIKQVCASINHF